MTRSELGATIKTSMHIQINSDHHNVVTEAFSTKIQALVADSLSRYSHQLTRVEVHLSDENSRKEGGNDKKCVLEARPAGLKPLAVSDKGATIDDAIDGAITKLDHLLEHTFGRLHSNKG